MLFGVPNCVFVFEAIVRILEFVVNNMFLVCTSQSQASVGKSLDAFDVFELLCWKITQLKGCRILRKSFLRWMCFPLSWFEDGFIQVRNKETGRDSGQTVLEPVPRKLSRSASFYDDASLRSLWSSNPRLFGRSSGWSSCEIRRRDERALEVLAQDLEESKTPSIRFTSRQPP